MLIRLLLHIKDNHYELKVTERENLTMLHVYYRVLFWRVARLLQRTGSLSVELGRCG